MTDINPTPSWAAVRQLEIGEFALGGANGNMNEQAKSLAARSMFLKQRAAYQYNTLAEANADIANIAVNQNVNVVDSGLYEKLTAGATTLTKSAYDPLTQAKKYTDKEIETTALAVNSTDMLLTTTDRTFTYADSTVVTSAVTALPISNGIEIKTASTASSVILSTQLTLKVGQPQTLTHKFKATAATSSQFMSGLTFGDGDNLRNVSIRNDGTIYTTTKTSTTSSVLAATVPQAVYAVGDIVECTYDWDGKDLAVQVKTPNGTSGKYTVSEVSNKDSSIRINQRGICTYTQYSPLLGALKDASIQNKLAELTTNVSTASNQTGLVQNFQNVINYGIANSNGTSATGSTISLDSSNLVYNVVTSTARNQILSTDLVAEASAFFEAELQFRITALIGTSARYMGLSVGDGASRRHYAWQGTGGVIEYNDSETVISTIAATGSARAYDVGSLCKMVLSRKNNGSGTLKIYVNSVIVGTYQLASVPSGKVYVCARSSPIVTYAVTSLKGMGYNGAVSKALVTIPQGTFAKLVNQISVPDAQAANPTGGFTCTGAQQIGATGQWAGCWIVANHGQVYEGSSVYNPSIVLLSPDRTKKINEWDMSSIPGIQSIQGVAWDSSDDTIWFVDKTNRIIRHIDFNGAQLSDFITAPADYTRINGLAYNPTLDALYIQNEGVKQIKLISCVDGVTVLGTWVSLSAAADQFYYDAARNWLMYSFGENGVNGQLHVMDLLSDKVIAIIELQGSQSIEGICISNNGNLVAFNDGGYHIVAKPPLNLSCEYQLNFDL